MRADVSSRVSTCRRLPIVLRCHVCAVRTEGQKTAVGPVSSDMPCKALNRSDDGKKNVSLPNKGIRLHMEWMDGWITYCPWIHRSIDGPRDGEMDR